MQLHVLQQLKQAVGTVADFDVQATSLPIDGAVLHDIAGSARLLRTDRGLLVSVHVAATLQDTCARCLTNVSCPITVEFEEEYIPAVDAGTGAPVRTDAPPDAFRIGPDFMLDLREGVRQYTLMSEPTKPLCKPDCAGLCPECGKDLNQGPCRCPRQADDRWQALAGLTIADKEGS